MATYKRLLSEKDFLLVQTRARAVWASNGVSLVAIYYRKNELVFSTRSVTEKHILYQEHIQLTDLNIEQILKAKKFREIESLVKNGNIKVYCSCPAFHYWGYQYMAWKRGYGLVKETRRPVVRNPYERGFVCKHLYAILQIFPLLARPVASKFRRWAKTQEESSTSRTSNYFGNRKVVTNLRDNEKVVLGDSIADEPLITADDIITDNIEPITLSDAPIIDTSDIVADALPSDVSDYVDETSIDANSADLDTLGSGDS